MGKYDDFAGYFQKNNQQQKMNKNAGMQQKQGRQNTTIKPKKMNASRTSN